LIPALMGGFPPNSAVKSGLFVGSVVSDDTVAAGAVVVAADAGAVLNVTGAVVVAADAGAVVNVTGAVVVAADAGAVVVAADAGAVDDGVATGAVVDDGAAADTGAVGDVNAFDTSLVSSFNSLYIAIAISSVLFTTKFST
jgi:hypothetical protein